MFRRFIDISAGVRSALSLPLSRLREREAVASLRRSAAGEGVVNGSAKYRSIVLALMLMAAAAPARAERGGIFTVTLKEAEEAVARAIEHAGAADTVTAAITSTRSGVLYRYGNDLRTEVKTLKLEEPDGRFSANLYFVSGEEVISVSPVSGRYKEMVMLPAVRQRLRHGDSIAAEDIAEIAYPRSKLRKDTVTEAAELIGKTPRRVISGGRPVRMSELQMPSLLEKGAAVQMRYATPYLTISTGGETLEAGAEGDTIRIRNTASGKIVAARVYSAEEVVVNTY